MAEVMQPPVGHTPAQGQQVSLEVCPSCAHDISVRYLLDIQASRQGDTSGGQ
jgi:hypothetical protein